MANPDGVIPISADNTCPLALTLCIANRLDSEKNWQMKNRSETLGARFPDVGFIHATCAEELLYRDGCVMMRDEIVNTRATQRD